MTMGGSKGLTVRATILAGVEDGLVPRPNSDLSEERRILYVAMTRAREYLFCTWAIQRRGPTAKGDVSKSNVLWSTNGGSYVPSPVLHKGHLFWINDSGIAICVDAKTGKEVAKKRIGGQFYASAVLIKDRIYAVSRFSGTYVLEATPTLTQVAHNELSDKSDFSASPAVSDGQLILRSDEYLYCVEAK